MTETIQSLNERLLEYEHEDDEKDSFKEEMVNDLRMSVSYKEQNIV